MNYEKIESKTSAIKVQRIAHNQNWSVYKSIDSNNDARFFMECKGIFQKSSDKNNLIFKDSEIIFAIEAKSVNKKLTFDSSIRIISKKAMFKSEVNSSLDFSKNHEHVFFSFDTYKNIALLKDIKRNEELISWCKKSTNGLFKSIFCDNNAYVFNISFIGFTSAFNSLKSSADNFFHPKWFLTN